MQLITSVNPTTLKTIGFFAIVSGAALLALYNKMNENNQQGQQQQNQKQKPVGISNQGNTCFVNSLLQALSSIELLKSNLQSLIKMNKSLFIGNKNQKSLLGSHYLIIDQLNHVFNKINSNTQNIQVLTLLQLLSNQSNNLINFQQQDAHQLFSVFTHSIQLLFNQQKHSDLSRSTFSQSQQQIQNYMKGYYKSSITCTSCKIQTKIKIDVFYDLSLEIYPFQVRTLDDALKFFQKPQYIDNWTCAQCSIKQHIKILQKSIAKVSQQNKPILNPISTQIIQFLEHLALGDTDLDEINNRLSIFVTKFRKVYDQLGQQNQDIRSIFLLIQPVRRKIIKQTQITKYPKILVIHFKQLCFDPYSGQPRLLRKRIDFSTKLKIDLRKGQRWYKLTSLLTHVGNQSMGHYFTFRKNNKHQNQWFLISDSYTKQVKQNFLKTNVPYMLFYQCEQ